MAKGTLGNELLCSLMYQNIYLSYYTEIKVTYQKFTLQFYPRSIYSQRETEHN